MTTPELIDIGANLAHDSFDADRAEVLSAAREAGVGRIVVTGSSAESNEAAWRLAQEHPGDLFSTAGVHPHHASDYDQTTDNRLRELQAEPEVVAVGECGLDYFRNFSPPEAQREAFRRQLDIAEATGKPVFLHQRDAHEDFLEILEPRLPNISRAVAHCFTGTETELLAYIELDLYIGITGWICDERRGAHLVDIVQHIPPNRLMLETDAPYLLPRSIKPKPSSRRNEPKYLPEVLRMTAAALNLDDRTVALQTTANAEQFFGLAPEIED